MNDDPMIDRLRAAKNLAVIQDAQRILSYSLPWTGGLTQEESATVSRVLTRAAIRLYEEAYREKAPDYMGHVSGKSGDHPLCYVCGRRSTKSEKRTA